MMGPKKKKTVKKPLYANNEVDFVIDGVKNDLRESVGESLVEKREESIADRLEALSLNQDKASSPSPNVSSHRRTESNYIYSFRIVHKYMYILNSIQRQSQVLFYLTSDFLKSFYISCWI
jgi:hypothetical protein